MEKDFGSWFHHQPSNWQTPNLNSSPFNLAQQNSVPAFMSPCTKVSSPNAALFGFPGSSVPPTKINQPIEPHGWFNFLPQAFTNVPNSIPEEKIAPQTFENTKNIATPNLPSGFAQKRFLVFDQSGDQTTLILSSGNGTPIQRLSSWDPKPNTAFDFNKVEPQTGVDTVYCSGPIVTDDDSNQDHRDDDVESEMHEDTEELNALLYSDDEEEDYSEDEDVASTGHSPNTMTLYDKQEFLQETEEVASSGPPTKRVKLSDGAYNSLPALTDTASSVRPKRPMNDENDAESSCGGDGKNHRFGGEFSSLAGSKRSRNDNIRETMSFLQKIVPGGKGKDTIEVIDETIDFLLSLKHEAKALGVDTL